MEIKAYLAGLGSMALALSLPFTLANAKPAVSGPPPGSKYVAMGSSFASGPGIGKSPDRAPVRCGRSSENYAHVAAASRRLRLVDVTCGGATTQHILGPWSELPAQIDAIDADTRLVTATIGGNDLNYIGLLATYSCRRSTDPASRARQRCPAYDPPVAADFQNLEIRLRQIVAEVKRRAPQARFVILQYPAMLPRRGSCPGAPLSDAEAAQLRAIGARLARITSDVAREAGASILDVSRLSRGHDACARTPWVNGNIPSARGDGVYYHPNRAGMLAQARALEKQVWGRKLSGSTR